jgi:hypothetical protein
VVLYERSMADVSLVQALRAFLKVLAHTACIAEPDFRTGT